MTSERRDDRREAAGHGGLDLEGARERLAGSRGRDYWRSLEELAGDPAFEDLLRREFPRQASEWGDGLDRRRFLQLAGASLALAGLACTRQPLERIVPYVRQPEGTIPGRPKLYATAMILGGYATGILVESHEGRPTKIEGNPDHPASLGATDALAQALVLGLYDPDRSQVLTELGEMRTWAGFVGALGGRLRAQQALGGEGIRILTETITSPTLSGQLRAFRARFPRARWIQYEPAGRDCVREGARLAFGAYAETRYDFRRADVILSLDADFVAAGPGSVRYARDFTEKRRARKEAEEMNRLYVVETTPTLAGTLADHHAAVPPSAVPTFALALAAELGVPGAPGGAAPLPGPLARWLPAVAADLRSHAGRGIVIAGEFAPAEVHALAHALNDHLGNAGSTVIHTDPVEAEPADQIVALRDLTDDMRAGRVEILTIVSGNPVFTAPADFGFTEALLKARTRIHLSLEENETSEYCQWRIPEAHALETWSDARAYDGTVTVMQPLIAPLYGGKSAPELLSAFVDEPPRSGHDLVRAHWQRERVPADFETFWRRALHDGVVPGTALPARAFPMRADAVRRAAGAIKRRSAPAGTIELSLRPDPAIHDGRYANNGWLQELPKPLSKLTWDNAALVSPALARSLSLANEDVVEIGASGRTVRAPVWILPGHPDGAVTVHFGYGRRRCGRVGSGAGFDAYPLRTANALWSSPEVTISKKPGEGRRLATTQHHFAMEGRNLVRVGTIAEFERDPEFARKQGEAPPRDRGLYPGFGYEGYAWGMAIDLDVCTGCNACVVACQAENNIPIVGKDQVLRGREMHWLRIDRYYEGSPESPETHHQPVLCMQCEQAPCEVVCPVGATSHSSEGLNDMVYNRCVGTRYCSNNCPYKVRRFNFLEYNGDTTPVQKMLRNPDVTVRSRGVMEKCTYCVQRINETRIGAEKEGRPIRDGEIVTACQQACPSRAIVFGNINDPDSRVSELKSRPTNYGILEELNTRPRTTYLAKLRNPNPALETG